jgi:hypothetical protein
MLDVLLAAALSLVIVGDVETMVSTNGGAFTRMTEELCTHPSLDGVIFTGDMTRGGGGSKWDRIDVALDVLDDCGLPYFLVYGNHDPKSQAFKNFTSRPFQPSWQYVGKKKAVPLYAHPLDDEWTIVVPPYKGKIKGDAAEWIKALPGRLLWVHHDCYKAKTNTFKTCKFPTPVDMVVSGGASWSPRQSWTLLDGVIAVFNNVQKVDGLEKWVTLLTLDGATACFTAWNPFTDETDYPGFGYNVKKDRYKVGPPDAPRCFDAD